MDATTQSLALVTDLLEKQAQQKPARVAIIDKAGEHTYGALNDQANRVAFWLRDMGVRTGDRVALWATNGARMVASIFGALKTGAIFIPLNPDTPPAKAAYIRKNCTPAAFVADSQCISRYIGAIGKLEEPILLTSDTISADHSPESNTTLWSKLTQYSDSPYVSTNTVLPTDLAAVIYTSGSTREPRGVMLPHRQMLFATGAINAVIKNTPEDIVLCGLPLSFDYGLYQIFLTFQVGAKLVLERDFSHPMAIPYLLKTHEITGFPGVPAIFALLLRSRLLERIQLPSLRYVTSTGDVFPVTYIRRLQELWPEVTVFPMYGLTECKRVSIMPRGQLSGHESSVGVPLPGTSVSIVDENGEDVPPGTVGELLVRGPHIMAGYWNDPRETARRFRCDPLSGESILYTGDRFYMDDDGFLYFVGRNEMFIKSRGHKISPLEIESSIYEIDGVAEVAAVGIPDPVLGEAIYVFVSLVSSGDINVSQIDEHCRTILAPSARPTRVIIFDHLPKTANGKIDRSQLQALAQKEAKEQNREIS